MKTLVTYLFCIFLVGASFTSKAYSVLSHEAVVDACWDKLIQPLLLKKYPGSTAEQLKEARSYAYGGAIVPDMGYFPFGSKLFTNLVHYVRSGDFVATLLDEAHSLNEYAFALGALAHYYGDNLGHPIGVNRSVPLVYHKMKKKYGDVVTYADNHISHTRMEFGFDVLQTARGNYKSQAYHDFIGFNVSREVLERAFLKTYGLEMADLFKSLPLSISTFRWSVKDLFPFITRSAWIMRKAALKKATPGITSRQFRYRMRRSEYFHEYGRDRERPGLVAGVVGFTLKLIPKRLVLRSLRFKQPNSEAEKLFIKSFDAAVAGYSEAINKISAGNNSFDDLDFDTGKKTAHQEYKLCDETYDDFVVELSKKKFEHVTPAIRQNILAFYNQSGKGMQASDKDDKVMKALQALKTQ